MSILKIDGKELTVRELEQALADLRPVMVRKPAGGLAKRIDQPFEVKTRAGTIKGEAGDYLVVGATGEPSVVKPDIFERVYEWI